MNDSEQFDSQASIVEVRFCKNCLINHNLDQFTKTIAKNGGIFTSRSCALSIDNKKKRISKIIQIQ